ncbi:glycosyltransferase family 1 [Fusobacterium necrophorum BFTR-2]|nr:glycosyltransferase [Fusobacterium necrophorum]KDE71241.1 glycosyltransferase family 1 [Fusobacterium necrophorum BFTR-2]
MKTILFIEGIYPINSRSQRIISTLGQEYSVRVVSWDRNNLKEKKEDCFIYSSTEGYGNKVKKLFGMYNYFKYVKEIFDLEKPEILFVSQWDMLIFGFFLKNRNVKLVYDNIDMPASTSIIIWNLLRFLEKILLKKCDIMIYASRFYAKNYIFFEKKTILLENLPLKSTYKLEDISNHSGKVRLAFVGTIRYYDILKKSMDVISKINNFEYHFYGTGQDEYRLKKYCEEMQYKNIFFHGKYNYIDIARIYNSIDILWAAYPNKDFNVKYAISNKFYESLIYEKPCFFSCNTKLGDYVDKNKIGFIIDPYNPKNFFETFNILDDRIKKCILQIKNYKVNKKLFWEDEESILLINMKDN